MDYLDWKEALNIYLNYHDPVKKLEIISDKTKNLNEYREDVNLTATPSGVAEEWFIGFIECEGSILY